MMHDKFDLEISVNIIIIYIIIQLNLESSPIKENSDFQ